MLIATKLVFKQKKGVKQMEEEMKELKVLKDEGIPVTPDAKVAVVQGGDKPEPEKPLQIIIGLIRTPNGLEVGGIGGRFPSNDIVLRGALDQAKDMICFRMATKRAQEAAMKAKILKPDMIGSLRQAGKKMGNIFK